MRSTVPILLGLAAFGVGAAGILDYRFPASRAASAAAVERTPLAPPVASALEEQPDPVNSANTTSQPAHQDVTGSTVPASPLAIVPTEAIPVRTETIRRPQDNGGSGSMSQQATIAQVPTLRKSKHRRKGSPQKEHANQGKVVARH